MWGTRTKARTKKNIRVPSVSVSSPSMTEVVLRSISRIVFRLIVVEDPKVPEGGSRRRLLDH